jgi:putative ABC transport system permease protein
MKSASRAERMFRRLLRLFPAEFRGDFGDEMAETFDQQRRDTLQHGGSMGLARLWWDTVRGIATTAPREHWDLFRQDIRYGLRNLRRNPGFTAVAVAALAVGIGANTSVFTIVNGVLLSALPFDRPDRLVLMYEQVPGVPMRFDFSAPDFDIVRDTARSFAGMAAYRSVTYELSGIAAPERINAARVSPALFPVLGVAPSLGRALTDEDDRTGRKVALLGGGLWSRAFGRDPTIVGRTITLDREPYTVVGVMPDRFEFPLRGPESNAEPAALYVPIAFTPGERQAFGSMYNNTVVARLQPQVTIERARAEIEAVTRVLAERYPAELRDISQKLTIPMSPIADEVVGHTRRRLLVLMGAVGIVLLIGCVDVANLMLTRSGARQRELAIRSALGASPARVVRQLVTEGFVLALLGGAVGLLLAYWVTEVLVTLAGETLPRASAVAFDRHVFVFTAGLALLTPLVFGVAPALKTALATTSDALKEGTRGATPGHARHRLLGALVVVQFALALMLSVGAGLLVRSFLRLLSTDPGFRAERVASVAVTLPAGRYATGQQIKSFYRDAIEAARRAPGVVAAGAGNFLPLHVLERRTFVPDPSARPNPQFGRTAAATWTVGSYFEALGITLKHGRFFTDADGRGGERVIIISELFAKALWPDQDPVGHHISWGIDENHGPPMTIVGVVGDVKQSTLDTPTVAQAYVPLYQVTDEDVADTITGEYRTVNLVARSVRGPESLIAAIRGELQRMDPALPIARAQTLDDMVGDTVKPQRFSMTVVAAFAIVALALAAIGIYGVLANAVSQQTHEIGVRMALGAARRDVIWLVLRRALALMAIGVGIGVAGALALARVMAGLLYEVRPTDGTTFLTSALLLAALAVAASLVPAWRATRVDPLNALRVE